jgi:hypothetical protein
MVLKRSIYVLNFFKCCAFDGNFLVLNYTFRGKICKLRPVAKVKENFDSICSEKWLRNFLVNHLHMIPIQLKDVKRFLNQDSYDNFY